MDQILRAEQERKLSQMRRYAERAPWSGRQVYKHLPLQLRPFNWYRPLCHAPKVHVARLPREAGSLQRVVTAQIQDDKQATMRVAGCIQICGAHALWQPELPHHLPSDKASQSIGKQQKRAALKHRWRHLGLQMSC